MLTDLGKIRYHNGGNIEPVSVALHSQEPAQDGSNFRILPPQPCAFDLADISDPEYRYLSADVEFTLTANSTFTHYSVYNSDMECIHIVEVATPRTLLAGDKINLRGSTAPRTAIRITSE